MKYSTHRLSQHVMIFTMLSVLMASPLSIAQTTPSMPSNDENFSLVFENDLFGSTDRHYTNGLRLGYSPATSNYQRGIKEFARRTGWFPENSRFRLSTQFGQNLYTPSDINRTVPDPDDRPYAGWLYATLGLQVSESFNTQNIELSLGVVGPQAGGRQSQTAVHEVVQSDEPAGWDHQLANETTVQINYQRSDLTYESQWRNRTLTAVRHVSLALGNAFTYAGTGASLRIGNGAAIDFGPPRIQPGVPGSINFYDTEWYLFASVEARAVARNLFLDGNTFKDGPSVEREPLVADLQLGWVMKIDEIKFGYTHVIRTREFTAQQQQTQFGALSISMNL